MKREEGTGRQQLKGRNTHWGQEMEGKKERKVRMGKILVGEAAD